MKKVRIIIIFIVLIAGGIFAWQYFGKQEEAKPQEAVEGMDVSGWQTYGDEEYGFEVKYPKGWKVKEQKFEKPLLLRWIPEIYATEPLNFYSVGSTLFAAEFTDPNNKEGRVFGDTVTDSRGVPQSIVVQVKRLEGDTPIAGERVSDLNSYRRAMEKSFNEGRIVKDYTLDGKAALYSRRNTGTGNEDIEYLAYDGYDEEVNVFLNNYLYSIYRNGSYYEDYFQQILSIFKFLDQGQTDSQEIPQPVKLAREDLGKQLNMAVSNIEIVKIEEVEWNDSSLGCPKEGFFYLQVITPGYRVTFQYEKGLYIYHTNDTDRFIDCE